MATSKQDVLDYANSLIGACSDRIKIQNAMLDVYNLMWAEKFLDGAPAWVMKTQDTQPADSIAWLSDILSSNDPQFDVTIPPDAMAEIEDAPTSDGMGDEYSTPQERGLLQRAGDALRGVFGGGEMQEQETPAPVVDTSKDENELEEALHSIFTQNDERRSGALLRELVRNGFLHDQVAIKCADLRFTKLWKGDEPEHDGKSPFVFVALDPRSVSTDWDADGICAALHREAVSVRRVVGMYGGKVDNLVKRASDLEDINKCVLLCEFWTRDDMAIWIERTDNVDKDTIDRTADTDSQIWLIEPRANPYKFIPIITKTCRGTGDNIRPILYNGWKSELFNRVNTLLTAKVTEAWKHAIGQFVRTGVANPNEAPLQLDFTDTHIYDLAPGQSIVPVTMPANPDVDRVLAVLDGKQQSATVSKVIAGDSSNLGATAASAINLLVHGAQLLLTPVQRAVEESYEAMAQMVFAYARAYQSTYLMGDAGVEMWDSKGKRKLDPTRFPKWLKIKVLLKADMPQDKIAMANLVAMLRGQKMIDRTTGWELVGLEPNKMMQRINAEMAQELAPMVNQQRGQPQPQGQEQGEQGIMSQALDPQSAAGMPVDQNPQAENGLDPATLAAAMERMNRG